MENWHTLETLPSNSLSPPAKELLHYPGSLTERLRELSQNQLTLELKTAQWEPLKAGEQALLQTHSKKAWVRTVVFRVDSVVWEWATTIIPESSLQGKATSLRTWGDRPIGDLLFSDPQLKRSEFEFTYLLPDDKTIVDQPMLTRRSVFYFYGQPVLIRESFSKALFRHCEEV